jgi:DNA-binding IclR family transcriptional regulator
MRDRSMNVWVVRSAAVLDWIGSRSEPFRALDLARGIDICPRSAYRILGAADLCGWVRRERVHHSRVVYHPLVRVGTRP